MQIVIILAAAAAAAQANSAAEVEGTQGQKKIALPPEESPSPEPGLLADEALIALNVTRGTDASQAIGTAAALRSAAGFKSQSNLTDDKAHIGGTGMISQGWNTGANSQTHGATNMTAHYGGLGTITTSTSGN